MARKSRRDDIEIIIKEDYAEVILCNTYAEEIARSLIDIEDIENVKKHKWFLAKDGYARCKSKDLNIKLHQFVFGSIDNYIIDHINGNKLDNRKSNLRYATISQNSMNKRIQSNNTSGYVGVRFREDKNKWQAYIQINSKMIYLGHYNNMKDAIIARKDAEIKYFGEFRKDWCV